MKRFQQFIQAADDLPVLERLTRQALNPHEWAPASQEVVVKIVLVMAEHVLRYAGRGYLRLADSLDGLEIVSEDRGFGFMRTYSAVRETGLAPALRAGIYEVVPTAHGDLGTLRTLADELHLECEPGRGMRVRAVVRGEPHRAPHAPCPCVVVSGTSARSRGH